MKVEELKNRKKEKGISNRALSELSGVPVGTIDKVFGGKTAVPRRATLEALEKALFPYGEEEEEPDHEAALKEPPVKETPMNEEKKATPAGKVRYDMVPTQRYVVGEMPAPYRLGKKQGEYTLEDYLALPDDVRVELIDGVFYNMSAPYTTHQTIAGFLYMVIAQYIRAGKSGCRAFIAPTDVQLDRDNRTIVQPDVMIVCDKSKINRARIFGAPDFIAEVLSPSTRRKDVTVKLFKYGNAGVREYWIIDPKYLTVTVCNLESLKDNSDNAGEFFKIYSFRDNIPVGIYDGELEVCFAEIVEEILSIED